MPHLKVLPLLFASAFVLIAGYFLQACLPEVIIKQIQKRVNISPGSPIYELWRDTPIPIYQRFYMFNITNAADIESYGAKPTVEEIGPFTYRMKLQKVKILFHENQTVSYKEVKTWLFEPSLSVLDENTVITTVNTPLVSTLTVLQRVPPAVRVLITLALNTITEGLFIKRSVKQLTFAGYPDLLVTFGPMIDPRVPNNHGRFGYLYPKNNTDEGLYTVFTGVDDPSKLNYLDRLNGQPKLSIWASEECNSLNNTFNGQLHPSLIDNFTSNYQFFNELFGRKFNLIFDSIYEPYEGVKAYKYIFDENNFKNSIDYPPNACYTSKLQPDQPTSMSRRSPAQDSPNAAPNILLNLARRRLSGEPIGLFNRPPVDRTESTEPGSLREEAPLSSLPPPLPLPARSAPSSQMARQAMRMLANSIATRTMEQLGRLGERISMPAAPRSAPSSESPASTRISRIDPAPSAAPLIQEDSSVSSSNDNLAPSGVSSPSSYPSSSSFSNRPYSHSDVNTAPPTTVTYPSSTPSLNTRVPLSPLTALFPVPATRESPILANLFRPNPAALENARELARNITRSAPINTMITNVLNSGLMNRLFANIRNRQDTLNRRSRQITSRRERRSRLRRRQTRQSADVSSFARLRELNKFPSGAFDFSQIAFGAPILLSLPHFLKADPFYLQQVNGLQPNQSKHEFYLDVEPISGASINTALRFQLNLALTRNPGLFRFRNIRETVLPVLWQEIVLEMPESQQRMLRLMRLAPTMVPLIVFAFVVFTSLLLIAFAVRTHYSLRKLQAKEASDLDVVNQAPPVNKLVTAESAQFDFASDHDQQRLHRSHQEAKFGIDNPIPVES